MPSPMLGREYNLGLGSDKSLDHVGLSWGRMACQQVPVRKDRGLGDGWE